MWWLYFANDIPFVLCQFVCETKVTRGLADAFSPNKQKVWLIALSRYFKLSGLQIVVGETATLILRNILTNVDASQLGGRSLLLLRC